MCQRRLSFVFGDIPKYFDILAAVNMRRSVFDIYHMLHIFVCHTFYTWYFWYYPLIKQRMQFAVVDLRCSDFDMLTYYMLHILYIERFILPSDIATKTFCSGEYMFLSISHIDIVLDMSNEMSNIYNIRNV